MSLDEGQRPLHIFWAGINTLFWTTSGSATVKQYQLIFIGNETVPVLERGLCPCAGFEVCVWLSDSGGVLKFRFQSSWNI